MTLHYSLAGIDVIKHHFSLALNYNEPKAEQITVFARELVAKEHRNANLPFLVYFQGGPGFAAQRPIDNSGWIKRALTQFRVLLLDQRGTGLSTPVNYLSLAHLTPREQADYLSHFRADNIINDAIAIKKKLSPLQPWSILGQSFGGFCVFHYLCRAPEDLAQAFITGGIPPINSSPLEVYQHTFARVKSKNEAFFKRFADAQTLISELTAYISENPVILASGEQLSIEMLQSLGIHLGMENGPEEVYYLLEQALINTASGKQINPLFLTQFSHMLDYNTNPLFAILHEAIYCQQLSSNWAAEQIRSNLDEFQYQPDKPFLFTGEMIFPWFFEQFNNLMPLKDCAGLLATKTDWPMLYDLSVLNNNKVPVAAAIYSEDMYVDMNLSLNTAKQVTNLQYWLTSQYEHNGIRIDGEVILDKLIALNAGTCLR
ncbi:alpha/beta fold hydrolase [Pseudoalteromonas tunicata]|uniref:alpha/beta fold hydrolase n=1 Tax=Pseudoalteromonas tunicata TaxID=314281 RepID=UPI00273D233D|nr:alpha/beta fold hydrolase [Pseudoalteromonas tunicata]MDP5213864.1 alpha/beta fold hydrolase [Pseudoalteromonas tunicata]